MLTQGQTVGAKTWQRVAMGGLCRGGSREISDPTGLRKFSNYSRFCDSPAIHHSSSTRSASLPNTLGSSLPPSLSILQSISVRRNGYTPFGQKNGARAVSTQSKGPEPEKPLPRLFYIQNPLIWANNKLDFRFLRKKWDPQFSEAEFQRGCRQAIATITQLISKNMFDALKPLLTKHALLALRREVEILWADEVRRNIALKPEEVQLIIPRKIHFRRLADKKLCDIDVVFIGLKWIDSIRINPQLIFIDIIARFHRNYSDNIPEPEWTVSAFRVRRFNILPTKSPQ